MLGHSGIAYPAYADFARFDLEDGFDRSLQSVLQSDDAIGLQAQGLDRLDVECVREVRGPELD